MTDSGITDVANGAQVKDDDEESEAVIEVNKPLKKQKYTSHDEGAGLRAV